MKSFLSHLAVLAVVLALPALALAQRGGGGGHGGGGFGGGGHYGGAGYGRGYYGHGFYGRGYYGGFYGFGFYGYGYPYGYYGYYDDPLSYPPPTFPRVFYPAYATPEYAAQAPPAGPDYGVPPPNVALPKNRAQVQVVVPDPEATVWFDGTKTASLGKVRFFDPPELQPGAYYVYKIAVSWAQGGQTFTDVRSVTVTGGQVTVVDFTRPASPEPLGPPLPSKKNLNHSA